MVVKCFKSIFPHEYCNVYIYYNGTHLWWENSELTTVYPHVYTINTAYFIIDNKFYPLFVGEHRSPMEIYLCRGLESINFIEQPFNSLLYEKFKYLPISILDVVKVHKFPELFSKKI